MNEEIKTNSNKKDSTLKAKETTSTTTNDESIKVRSLKRENRSDTDYKVSVVYKSFCSLNNVNLITRLVLQQKLFLHFVT